MQETVLTKEKLKSNTIASTTSAVSTEVDKVIVGSIAAFAGVVGLWSIACLASAAFQSGGPLQLAGGWLHAISGM